MEALKEQIENLIEASKYNKAVNIVAKEFNIKLNVLGSEYKRYFTSDTQSRQVFKLQLKRGRKSYTFQFGQSIAKGNEEPTLYDVLTCLTKYEVGSFEDFCGEFGYDEDSRTSEKIYRAVVKEYEAMSRLFNDDELKVLQCIA